MSIEIDVFTPDDERAVVLSGVAATREKVVRINATRNAVIVEITRDGTRPVVHIECKDDGARPQLEELARQILFLTHS